MMSAAIPTNEQERLDALRSYGILDTDAEEEFDAITRLAAYLCGTPVALISLVDATRQWFKSRHGLPIEDTTRALSFCGHAINGENALVVEDAALDPRFAQNPLVLEEPHIRFYAGHPVKGPGGHSVGTLCIMDNLPREFSAEDRETLRDLGEMVEKEFKVKPKGKKKVVAPPD